MDRRGILKLAAAGMGSIALTQLPGCRSTRTRQERQTEETLRNLAAGRGLLVGAACNCHLLNENPVYREVLAREFNCIVAENSMKLATLQPKRGEYDFSLADGMMDFAALNRMKVRAVPLVWHDALPGWAKGATFSRREALDILREHIFTVMGRYRRRIFAWDVLNEGLNDKGPGLRKEGPWNHSIGPDYVDMIYHWAHEADPDAQLFYNEFGMDGMSEKAHRCYQWIKELLSRGVPIHGIGLQFHVQVDHHPDKAEILRNIRRFNDLGLVVHITELDVWIPTDYTDKDLLKQAEIYRGIFETALAAENCPAVVCWGFTDSYSWVPGISRGKYDHALLFDRDYQPKPAYEALCSLLRES